MSVRVVVGAQWGDEGKGKIVDLLSAEADFVVRYQGGANAGHTVVVKETPTVLHLVPSGILHPASTCVLGNGLVIDVAELFRELDELAEAGVSWAGRIWVSERAHLILPVHRALEALEEQGPGAVGTTLRGIGPAYRDKMARIGIPVAEFLDRNRFRAALARQRLWKERLASELPPEAVDPDAVEAALGPYRPRLTELVRDTGLLLARAARQDKRILLEGAQGTLLDVDHGTYPFVTSSSASAGGAFIGSGLAPRDLDEVIGITKAYCTRVGLGPFPTEVSGAEGEALRERGAEFGATTGRPRRCGWLDGLALRHAARVNGLDWLAVTKLDVLSGRKTVPVATAYRAAGQLLTEFPGRREVLEAVEPVYEELEGWSEEVSGARRPDQLPEAALRFLRRVGEIADVPVRLVSVGPAREQTIRLE